MDNIWIILINSFITFFVCGVLYNYFMHLFNLQADLMDKVIHQLKLKNGEDSEDTLGMPITTLMDYYEEE